jgi:hypothetical protein
MYYITANVENRDKLSYYCRICKHVDDAVVTERAEGQRLDNPERVLLFELVGGMKVQSPEGFVPNGPTLGPASGARTKR